MGKYKVNEKNLEQFLISFQEQVYPVIKTQTNGKSGISKLEEIVAKRRIEVNRNKLRRQEIKYRKMFEALFTSQYLSDYEKIKQNNTIYFYNSNKSKYYQSSENHFVVHNGDYLRLVSTKNKAIEEYVHLNFDNIVKNDTLSIDSHENNNEEIRLQFA